MRSLGSMLVETYSAWLRSVSSCCGHDDASEHTVDNKPVIVLRDQPAYVPPPSAVAPWMSEEAYEKTLEQGRKGARSRPSTRSRGSRSRSWSRSTIAGTPWFSRSGSSRHRPKISGPSNFRHLHSEAFQFPSPEPAQKRFSFRPLELGFEGHGDHLSPLLPYFDDGDIDRDSMITPPPRAHTAGGDKWDGSSATLGHDRSYSSMSFHVPRRNAREGSISSSQSPLTPPRIPERSRARAYTSPSPHVERIVERIASALIEKERLQAEIESIMERQSIYISSRPSTAYGIPELEPMPSIPALPAAAPSFAERLSTEGRPHTAPPSQEDHHHQAYHQTQNGNTDSNNMDSQERTLALAAAAFNSHPFHAAHSPTDRSSPSNNTRRSVRNNNNNRNDRPLDRPLAPPLPLVLRPPLRKKKSFSRVSNWLFPGGESHDANYDNQDHPQYQYQYRSNDRGSVTNAPRPVRAGEGFYVPSTSTSLSTWETETEGEESEEEEREDGRTVPTTTTWSPGSSPVVLGTPKEVASPVAAGGSSGGLGVVMSGPRPTSVGVAF